MIAAAPLVGVAAGELMHFHADAVEPLGLAALPWVGANAGGVLLARRL